MLYYLDMEQLDRKQVDAYWRLISRYASLIHVSRPYQVFLILIKQFQFFAARWQDLHLSHFVNN